MGQTVRNQGPYDRLWMPGVPHNRKAPPAGGSKIEYLDERRRAKAERELQTPDGVLRYDSNFSRTAAAHGDRPVKQHYRRQDTAPARPRPQGVGGRQQRPRTGAQPQAVPGRKPAQGKAAPRNSQPAAANGRRQGSPGGQQQRTRQQAGQPQQARKSAQTVKPNPPAGARPKAAPAAGGKPAGGSRGARPAVSPQAGRLQAAATKPRPSGRPGARPQRDTATDFRSVAPPVAAGRPQKPAAQTQAPKKSNGHGRKLTPKMSAKAKAKAPRKQKGTSAPKGMPIMEGGVVGFDIGTYGREPGTGPATRPVRTGSVITTILTIVICFVLLTAVLAGQARLSNYSQQNAALEKNIADMEERISKLKMQIALEEDLGNIQDRAAALGLQSPDDSQIEYVDLEETDVEKEAPSLVLSEQGAGVTPPDLFGALAAWFDTMLHGSAPAEVLTNAPASAAPAASAAG